MLPTGSLIETVHETTFLANTPEAIAAFLTRPAGASSATGGDATNEAVVALAEQISQRNAQLEQSATALRRFHDPQQSQWVMAVHEILQSAFRSPDDERVAHLKDALPLLQPVIEHPLTGRDYSLRFLFGWLVWKTKDSPAEATPPFAEAARLSALAKSEDPYPTYILRHLAYMLYLQGNFPAAHEAIQRAIQREGDTSTDLELVYEAARYAARTGEETTARALLARSFELSPLTSVWAVNEEDFKVGGIGVASILVDASHEAGTELESGLEAWRVSLAEVRRVGETLAESIPLPDDLSEAALEETGRRLKAMRSAHDLLVVPTLRATIENAAHAVLVAARAHMEQTLGEAEIRKSRVMARIAKLDAELVRWRGIVRALVAEAKQGGFSLTDKPGFKLPFLPPNERRKRVEAAQMDYVVSLENEADAKRLHETERPTLRAESKTLTKRIKSLKAAIAELQIALGEKPADATPDEPADTAD